MKRIKRLGLLLTACLLMCACQAEDTSPRQQELKLEGMELHAAGDYEGAIAKYNEALQLSDMKVGAEEADIAYYKASAQYRSGDLEGAIDTYSAVLELVDDAEAYLGRGLLYIEAKDAEHAQEDFNKALNDTDSPLLKGIIYNTVDQPEKAKEYFEKAKESGEADAIFFLANAYEKSGDHNYAMILLEEYISVPGASAEGYLTVARHYFEEGSYEDALAAVQSGIALGESGVYKYLLQEEIACYERLGDYESAREKADDYLDVYPDDIAIQKEYEILKTR